MQNFSVQSETSTNAFAPAASPAAIVGGISTTSWQEIVDGCWEDFVASLPSRMQQDARNLPLTLGLTSKPLPWSRIFHQEVTLALPHTLSEGISPPSLHAVRIAVRAHLLGIVAAFGADRLEDKQIAPTPRILTLLNYVSRSRDRAIDWFGINGLGTRWDYRAADRATAMANQAEQSFLARNSSADFSAYKEFSLPKQLPAFPAAMTLAKASGLDSAALDRVERMCLGMAMGLQFRDDATDWEDDHSRDRAWAVRLLRHAEGHDPRSAELDSLPALQQRMAKAGVIVELLLAAAHEFEEARDAAIALSAQRVTAWCARQATLTRDLAAAEERDPGHIIRWEIARKQARK